MFSIFYCVSLRFISIVSRFTSFLLCLALFRFVFALSCFISVVSRFVSRFTIPSPPMYLVFFSDFQNVWIHYWKRKKYLHFRTQFCHLRFAIWFFFKYWIPQIYENFKGFSIRHWHFVDCCKKNCFVNVCFIFLSIDDFLGFVSFLLCLASFHFYCVIS
jgi:hypothetical protein